MLRSLGLGVEVQREACLFQTGVSCTVTSFSWKLLMCRDEVKGGVADF